jgi:hypothetical protein
MTGSKGPDGRDWVRLRIGLHVEPQEGKDPGEVDWIVGLSRTEWEELDAAGREKRLKTAQETLIEAYVHTWAVVLPDGFTPPTEEQE